MTAISSGNVGKFGKIALQLGLVNLHQIQECLAIQMDYERSGREVPKLGTILLAKGYLSSAQVKEILEQQKISQQRVEDQNAKSLLDTYAAGTVIFEEGDHSSQDMFLIQSGTVELRKRGVHLLDRCGEGTFFGITSCLLKTPRNATAVAKTECRVFRIPAQKAQDFFRAKPAMAVRLASLLAENLFALKNRFVESQLAHPRQVPPSESAGGMSVFDLPAAPAVAPTPLGGASAPATVRISPPVTRLTAAASTSTNAKSSANPSTGSGAGSAAGGDHSVGLRADGNANDREGMEPANAPDSSGRSQEPTTEQAQKKQTVSERIRSIRARAAEVAAGAAVPDLSSRAPSLVENEEPATPSAQPPAPVGSEIDDRPPELGLSQPQLAAEAGAGDEADDAGEDDCGTAGTAATPDLLGEAPVAATNEDIPEDERDVEPDPAEALFVDADAPPAPEPAGPDLAQLTPEDLPGLVEQLPAEGFPRSILEAVQVRVDLFLETEKIEVLRAKLEQDNPEGLPEPVKNEIARQRRELQRIPPFDALKTGLEKLDDMLKPDGKIPAKDAMLRMVMEWARQQKKVLLQRARITLQTLRTCAPYAAQEPLYGILCRHGTPADVIFGWGVYGLALRSFVQDQQQRTKDLRPLMDGLDAELKNKGFLGFGRGKNRDENLARRQELEEEDRRRKLLMVCANRELVAVEKAMVDEFWNTYNAAGQLLVAGVSPAEGVFLRALLRWGALGFSRRWLPQEVSAQILEDCKLPPEEPVFDMSRTHLYYADELIVLTAQGLLPPTSNEDLELNQRNSPLWKADRAWRRIINCRMQEGIQRDILKKLSKETADMRDEQAARERELEHAHNRANDKEKRRIISQLRHTIQNCKVKAGRLERICERIELEQLPRNVEDRQAAHALLGEVGVSFTPADLAAHELKCLRRNARLVAKLREPFLPYTLAERFKPEAGLVNTRETALAALADAQMRDPLVFQEPLIPSAKRIHRILLRISPIVIIAPAGGILGFMLGARGGMDCGRLVLPAYVERANMREEILWNLLSDFRYDTSKASAGMDLMNSDTLVAAYAQVRWNLRKRDRELRQKAAIYTEENERTNWRRHYALYMKSALDSGKLLFYKCPELYELIINKYIDLPGGCELLRR